MDQYMHYQEALIEETETGDKLVPKLNDVQAPRKPREDMPGYLLGSGSGGDAIVFDAKELEGFLGASTRENPLRKLARRLTTRCR